MASYKEMYYILFNAMTDAVQILQDAQRKTEEMFMEEETWPVLCIPDQPTEEQEK